MSQHFLLSSKARGLSLAKLFSMSDEQAKDLFAELRWSETEGSPVCPACGHKEFYSIKTRNQFRCKDCAHTYSVTSNTIFANNKLPIKTYLIAIAIFTNAVKSVSALQLSRDLNCQYKTAWVLAQKIRESLLINRNEEKLDGVCEIDGVYTGSYIRPKNDINKRIDRRKVFMPKKRVIISIRQRAENGVGASRTLTHVLRSENSFDIKNIVLNSVEKGATIHADDALGYDDLHAYYDMKRVNHKVQYSDNGISVNQCESYNSRFRRMQYGQCHHISHDYLAFYANEIAYREDMRRTDNLSVFRDIVTKCAISPTSQTFVGYWQKNKKGGV